MFEWIYECSIAFAKLKEALCSAPVLASPKDVGRFFLDTYASLFSIGALLSKIQEEKECVIAYASNALSSSQTVAIAATDLADEENGESSDFFYSGIQGCTQS